jgi:hypothetical protein
MAWGSAKGALQPTYAAGRDTIIGKTMRRAVGDDADVVAQRLAAGRGLIPGSQPTAAEVAQSGGISALQRAASAIDPQSYAAQQAANNQARVAAISNMAGARGQRDVYDALRKGVTSPLYEKAVAEPVDKALAKSLAPQIDNLMARPSMKFAQKKAAEIFGEESIAVTKDGSAKGLQLLKQALDDLIERAPENKIGKNQLKALLQTRGDLVSLLQDLSPRLRVADIFYQKLSKPINQMDVAQELLNKSGALSGELRGEAFANAMRYADKTAQKALGYKGASFEKVMTPQQTSQINNIVEELRRVQQMQNLGRGAGSDTVQKMAMSNLMRESGLPMNLMNLPILGRFGNYVYQQTDDLMKQRLAQVLRDPKEAARLMQRAKTDPAVAQLLENIRRGVAPGVLGVMTSDALQ